MEYGRPSLDNGKGTVLRMRVRGKLDVVRVFVVVRVLACYEAVLELDLEKTRTRRA